MFARTLPEVDVKVMFTIPLAVIEAWYTSHLTHEMHLFVIHEVADDRNIFGFKKCYCD